MVSKEFFGETKNIEFKREIPVRHEKFLKDIIAFSNSTGGQIIVGIEDKTVLVIDVAPGKFRPYYLANKDKESTSYIRINGTSRPADARKL